MGMFLLGWVVGVLSVFLFAVSLHRKNKGTFGYPKSAQEAADKMMTMLNADSEVREAVKNRLNVSD